MEDKMKTLVTSFTLATERAFAELEETFLKLKDYESLTKLKKLQQKGGS